MMFTSHVKHPADAIVPGQLAMLQRVFDQACAESGIEKNTPRAEGLAATLIELYNSGIHDEERLENMLADIHPI